MYRFICLVVSEKSRTIKPARDCGFAIKWLIFNWV
jgi:hypothetical protein